jgi:hypothetical protein
LFFLGTKLSSSEPYFCSILDFIQMNTQHSVPNWPMFFCFLSSFPLLPPQPPRQCLAPSCHLYLLTLNLTLYRRFRPACPYDWRGFVETKKGDDRGPLIVFNPLCSVLTPLKIMNLVIASPLHQLCILGGGGGRG